MIDFEEIKAVLLGWDKEKQLFTKGKESEEEQVWVKNVDPLFTKFYDSGFFNSWVEESYLHQRYGLLTKENLPHRGKYNKVFNYLRKNFGAIFPTINAFNDENNQKKWHALLDFVSGHSLSWTHDFLEYIANTETRLDAVLLLIEHFQLTAHDLSKSAFEMRDLSEDEIWQCNQDRFMGTNIDDLPLPPELSPFEKKEPVKKEALVFNPDNFYALETILSLLDEHSSKAVQFLIYQGFLDFAIIQGVIQHVVEISKNETEQKAAFKQWLENYLVLCDLTPDTLDDDAWKKYQCAVSDKQASIRQVVKRGFSEQYTKKAFAHFALNERKTAFFEKGNVSLSDSEIANPALLVDFLNALPVDVSEVQLYDQELDDEALCFVLESLKRFSALTHLSFDQTLLKGSSQEIFKEVLATLPLLKSVTYGNTKDAQGKQDTLSFLQEQKLLISIVCSTEEEKLEIFNYNQALESNAHTRLSLYSVIYLDLYDEKTREHIFDYLSKDEVKLNLTSFSGDISSLGEVSDLEDLEIENSLSPFLNQLFNTERHWVPSDIDELDIVSVQKLDDHFSQLQNQHLSKFLSLLSQLDNLTHLRLEVVSLFKVSSLNDESLSLLINGLSKLTNLRQIEIIDRSLDDEDRQKMWDNAILALQKDNRVLEVTIYNEPPVPEKPIFSPLPNETLSSAFAYEASHFSKELPHSTDDESTLNVTAHTPATLGSCISLDEFKAFRPFQDKATSQTETALQHAIASEDRTITFFKLKNAALQAYKQYAHDFFDAVIVPIFEERERLVGELEKLLIQTHFDDEAEIISNRIDLLSGFLDKQEKNLKSFEKLVTTFDADKSEKFKLWEENPLILNLKNSFNLYTDTKVSSPYLPLNTQYLNKRLPQVKRVLSRKNRSERNSEHYPLDNKSLHQARHAVGSFLNKVLGAFLMLPSALINVSTFGHYNAIGKTYAQFFIPKTERKLLQIQEKAQQLSPTILKV